GPGHEDRSIRPSLRAGPGVDHMRRDASRSVFGANGDGAIRVAIEGYVRRHCLAPPDLIPGSEISARPDQDPIRSDRIRLNAGAIHLANSDRAGINRPDNAALCRDCACGDLLGRDRAVLDVRVANRDPLTVLVNVRLVLVGNIEPQVAFAHPLSRLIRLVEVLCARTVDDDVIQLLTKLVLHPLNLRLTV